MHIPTFRLHCCKFVSCSDKFECRIYCPKKQRRAADTTASCARGIAQEVGMSVVGKYRYSMASPAENDRVPIIVDIILVTSSLC